MKKRILLVGSGAREHSLAKAICRSPQQAELVVFATSHNPGIAELATVQKAGNIADVNPPI